MSEQKGRDAQAQAQGLTRRELVKRTGAAGAALAAGAGLFGGKPPAFGQTREMHVLEWSSFIKESDKEVDRQAEEFGKMEGIRVKVEHINNNDLNTRATAAVESGTGPDVIQLFGNQPLLFAKGFADHSDLVAERGGDTIYPFFRESVRTEGGRYVGLPYFATGAAYVYRRDIFDEAGVGAPETWDEMLDASRKIKDLGYPVGQALGHSFGDPPGFAYAMLWSFGGSMIDEKANVAINSRQTRDALNFMKELWKAGCDESGLGWDDSANNRAFFAETIGCTRNGASIYFVAKRNWNKDKNPFVWRLHHFLDPKGPGGRKHSMTSYARSIFKHSPVQTAAKNYLRYITADEQFDRLMRVNNGYINGPVPKWETHPLWRADPALTPYATAPASSVTYGWPGPYDRRASEATAKYIVVDLFARAVKGDSVDSAVKWAEDELKQIYG